MNMNCGGCFAAIGGDLDLDVNNWNRKRPDCDSIRSSSKNMDEPDVL